MTSTGVSFRIQGLGGVVGRVFLGLFFLLFLAAGMFFTALVLRDAWQTAATWNWKRVECWIESSAVVERNETSSEDSAPYAFEVRFTYSFDGRPHTSDRHRRSPAGFADYTTPARLALRFPAGSTRICHVNPSNPDEAVLELQRPWAVLALPFPLVFVAVGAAGIYSTIRRRGHAAGPEGTAPMTAAVPGSSGARYLVPFLSLFLFAGLAASYPFALRPLFHVFDARGWKATPCVVVSSVVRHHRGDDGPTYSADILYAYTVDGTEYRSNRRDFVGGSSSGYQAKADIVNNHPPGTRLTCYVKPGDPLEAVLERGLTSGFLLGLIPLAFVAAGGGGILLARRAARLEAATSPARRWVPRAARTIANSPAVEGRGRAAVAAAAGPVALRPSASPWMSLAGSIVLAIFWNGIVSVFVYHLLDDWKHGQRDWFLALFLVPFVLVGLAILGSVVYLFLALFNPRPLLTVQSNALVPGDTLDLQWRLDGRIDSVERLRIWLEGREEATYRRGTSTSTDREVFAAIELANVTGRQDKRSGQRRLVIPNGVMHSFESPHNKIVWALQLHGAIRWWPDVKLEFPILILPRPANPPRPV